MLSSLLPDLLATQDAAWREGRDITAELVARPGVGDLAPLLWLGQALWRVLVPVTPRPDFVAALRQALRAPTAAVRPPTPMPSRPRRRAPWLAVAAVGSARSLTGLVWLRRQRGRNSGHLPMAGRPARG